MAQLVVTAYKELAHDLNGNTVMVGVEPNIGGEDMDFTSGQTVSGTFPAEASFLYLNSDTDCRVSTGTNPTATTSSVLRLPANAGLFIGIMEGLRGNFKVSVIAE